MPLTINGNDYANLMCALETRKQRIEKMMDIYVTDPTLRASYEEEMRWIETMKRRIERAVFPSLYPETVNQNEQA